MMSKDGDMCDQHFKKDFESIYLLFTSTLQEKSMWMLQCFSIANKTVASFEVFFRDKPDFFVSQKVFSW